jgi:ribonuclease HI
MPENIIKIFTDGACKGNPGLGGWGALIIEDVKETEIYGGNFNTTNNQMELKATIEALNFFKDPKIIEIYTDSKYVKDGITEWIINWKKMVGKMLQKNQLKIQIYG